MVRLQRQGRRLSHACPGSLVAQPPASSGGVGGPPGSRSRTSLAGYSAGAVRRARAGDLHPHQLTHVSPTARVFSCEQGAAACRVGEGRPDLRARWRASVRPRSSERGDPPTRTSSWRAFSMKRRLDSTPPGKARQLVVRPRRGPATNECRRGREERSMTSTISTAHLFVELALSPWSGISDTKSRPGISGPS